jgi:hypothetical protein
LKASNKALFKEVASDLILGIGINAVFIKPHSEPESLLALRAGANEGAHITPASQDQTLVGL